VVSSENAEKIAAEFWSFYAFRSFLNVIGDERFLRFEVSAAHDEHVVVVGRVNWRSWGEGPSPPVLLLRLTCASSARGKSRGSRQVRSGEATSSGTMGFSAEATWCGLPDTWRYRNLLEVRVWSHPNKAQFVDCAFWMGVETDLQTKVCHAAFQTQALPRTTRPNWRTAEEELDAERRREHNFHDKVGTVGVPCKCCRVPARPKIWLHHPPDDTAETPTSLDSPALTASAAAPSCRRSSMNTAGDIDATSCHRPRPGAGRKEGT
jgi:hypothetical protein